jgi:hypothetical protein
MEWPLEVPAQLLSMGSDLEVLEPAELRSRVVTLARRILERYPDVPGDGPSLAGSPSRADPVAIATAASGRGVTP